MAARAISSGTISFGLVSIPVKLFTSASSQTVRFNMLNPETGARVKQQLVDASTGDVVERGATVKGYEYAKGQFVQFTAEELKALEAERTSSLEIVEFVPLKTFDFVQVEKSYYLGPDKGGDKAYKLLSQSMERNSVVAVARYGARGKDYLVMLRPYKDGLLMHQLYYATEVRSFEDVDTGATFTFSEKEQDLADKLIEQLSVDEYTAEKYTDGYTERVRAAVEQKVAGMEVTLAPEQPKAQIIDLFEALKKSLTEPAGAEEEPAPAKKPSKPKAKAKAPTVKKAKPRKTSKKSTKKASSG